MIQWRLTCYTGESYLIPTPLAWQLDYGLGSPCDSFWVKFPWEPEKKALMEQSTRVQVTEDGVPLFTGVVDEWECTWSQEGRMAQVTGRGMQALLLDNQAEAADYGQATLGEILRNYVTPYGITLEQPVSLPSVWGFSVSSGSSCWSVLYDFARYYAGVTPRFHRNGNLCLHPWTDGTPKELSADLPVIKVVDRYTRYGVLSQVTVKDVTGWRRQTETNDAFQAQGGCCSRVMLLPKNTSYQARRYNARFQLDRSAARMKELEVTIAQAFPAWPGELVKWNRSGMGRAGTYRVLESRVSMGEQGYETILVLGDPQAVL